VVSFSLESASEICDRVIGRALLMGILDPRPRDLARELLLLNEARFRKIGHVFPPGDMVAAFWFLVPPAER